MPGSKISKYIAYAIGEIVLVVIGILIAVSINNANERSKEEDSFRVTLQILKSDLISDTTKIAGVMEYYKQRDSLYGVFLSEDVSTEDYYKNQQGFNLTLTYNPISFNRKAYGLLENYANEENIANDTLVTQAIELYLNGYHMLEDNQNRISRDIDAHLDELKSSESWLVDMMRGRLSEPMMYYFTSKKYQNRLFVHVMYVKGNLLQQLYMFKQNAAALLKEVDTRLDELDK